MCRCLLGEARCTVLCLFRCLVFSTLPVKSPLLFCWFNRFFRPLETECLAAACWGHCCCSGVRFQVGGELCMQPFAGLPLTPCSTLPLFMMLRLSLLKPKGTLVECLHIELFTCGPLPTRWSPFGVKVTWPESQHTKVWLKRLHNLFWNRKDWSDATTSTLSTLTIKSQVSWHVQWLRP